MTGDGSAGGRPADRLAARAMAHTLIEQTQVAPRPELVERLTEEEMYARAAEALDLPLPRVLRRVDALTRRVL